MQDLQQSSHKQCKFTLVVDENDRPSMSENGTPQIYFDQMNVIHAHLSDIRETISKEDMTSPHINKVQVP